MLGHPTDLAIVVTSLGRLFTPIKTYGRAPVRRPTGLGAGVVCSLIRFTRYRGLQGNPLAHSRKSRPAMAFQANLLARAHVPCVRKLPGAFVMRLADESPHGTSP